MNVNGDGVFWHMPKYPVPFDTKYDIIVLILEGSLYGKCR